MKIFTENPKSWGRKVNFVDQNNTVVSYDLSQDGYEHAGWYVSEYIRTDTDEDRTTTEGLDGYTFDREFFEQVEDADVEDGGMVRFRLVKEGKHDLVLHIFNSHNGYHGHGFTVEHSGKWILGGVL